MNQPSQAVTGLHIEPTNICTLKCASCARTRFIEQWPQHWKNHSINIDDLLKFIDIDLDNKKIVLCGNTGDPIYHPDFIELVSRLKARGATLVITTNGSYRKQHWWEELVTHLTANDNITFSVDGTPENFTNYRVNADWESIHTGMQVVSKSLCDSTWKYIPFSYNQHNIEEVNQLSCNIGIKNFQVEFSDRFDKSTEFLKPDNSMIASKYFNKIQWKSDSTSLTVSPRCDNRQEHFVSADGYYSPCCNLADYRFYYKTIFGKNKKNYNISQYTFTQILEQPKTIEFYQTLDQHPGCQFNCPKNTG